MLFEEKVRTMHSALYGRILTKYRKAIRKTTAKTTEIKEKKNTMSLIARENEKMNKKVPLESAGNDPSTSSMLSGRSTI